MALICLCFGLVAGCGASDPGNVSGSGGKTQGSGSGGSGSGGAVTTGSGGSGSGGAVTTGSGGSGSGGVTASGGITSSGGNGGSARGGSGVGGRAAGGNGTTASGGASGGGVAGGIGGTTGSGGATSVGTPMPSAGCGKSGRPANGKIQVANESLTDFPTTYDGTKPFPLVIGLHACGNPNTEFETLTKGTSFETEYVRTFPNTPDSGQCWSNYTGDVARILSQYDSLMANYCIDMNRVFAI
ncbi:MAG TPA: hypothetical protein VGP07_20450, partial [Polyangia bacterium]